jgi:hypothetical protein
MPQPPWSFFASLLEIDSNGSWAIGRDNGASGSMNGGEYVLYGRMALQRMSRSLITIEERRG